MPNTGPRNRTGGTLNAFMQARHDEGLSRKQFGKKHNMNVNEVGRVEDCNFAPNHPRVGFYANTYGIAVDTVKAMAKKPPMADGIIARVAGSVGVSRPKGKKAKPGKALVHVPKKRGVPMPAVERTYDVQRPIPTAARQFMRTLVDRVNLSTMKGVRYLDLRAVPVAELAEMLGDYVHAKGITKAVVLAPNYGGIFDED